MPNNDQNQIPDQQLQATQQPANPPTAQPPAVAPAVAPTAQPTAQPQPSGQPNPYSAARPMSVNPSPAQTDPHSQHVNFFAKILNGLNPGTRYVDASGQTQVDRSVPTLGKLITASVLSGMFAKTETRPGEYGPVYDGNASASNAFSAGRNQQQSTNDALAKQSADAQARKMQTVKNNIDNMTAYASSVMLGHKFMDDTVARQQLILNDLKEYDNKQTDPANKLIVASGLTMQDAMAQAKGNMVNYNMIPDGSKDVYNPETGTLEPTMLFSLVRNTGTVPMSDDAVKELSQVIPQYAKAIDLVGSGNVKVPINMYVGQMHLLNGVHAAEQYMKTADPILGVDPSKVNFKAAILAHPELQTPVAEITHTLAQGGTTDQVLERIMKSDHGNDLLDAMGLKPDAVAAYVEKQQNERIRQNKLAQEGGIGDNAPAPPQMLADLTAAAKKLHPEQAQAIMAGINPNGLTVGEAEKIKNNILQAQNANTSNSQPTAAGPTPTGFVFNPDAPTMDSPALRQDLTKQGVKVPANFEALYGIAHNANPLTTLPPNPRKGSNQMSAQEGLAFIRQYINPNYQEGDYAAASGLSKELASTRQGTAGGTLYNAGTASQHLELLDEAAKALGNHDVQALNHLANRFGVAVGDSPAVTFKAIAEQVNGEVGKVVAGGTPHEAELAELRSNLNSDQSPEQTKKVIRAYVNLMAGRINEINERSQQYFNRDVKGVSPTTAKVFNAYGVPAPGQVKVTLNGQSFIAQKNQVAAIQKKYPTAVIGE